jgi:hypothetical protein
VSLDAEDVPAGRRPLTTRVLAQLAHDYPAADVPGIRDRLERLDFGTWKTPATDDGRERVIAAIVILGRGDRDRLDHAIERATRDWRDVLVWARLGQGDWAARIDERFGPAETEA